MVKLVLLYVLLFKVVEPIDDVQDLLFYVFSYAYT